MEAITTASQDVTSKLNEIFTGAKISLEQKTHHTIAKINTQQPLNHKQLEKIMAIGHINDLYRSGPGITMNLKIEYPQ